MAKQCEACATAGRGSPSRRVRNLVIGGRIIHLCEPHAQAVRAHDPRSVDEVRSLLKELDGRRSLIARRSVVNRRVFPPRPEGRRCDAGRRSSDRDL